MTNSPSRKAFGTKLSILWDNSTVLAPGCGKYIVATSDEFQAVASFLLSNAALLWPDDNLIDETDRPIDDDFNEFLRNACQRIAMQLLSATMECGVLMGYQLRVSPTNPCIMEQYIEGTGWILAFNYEDCMAPIQSTINNIYNNQQTNTTTNTLNQLIIKHEKYEATYEGTSESYDPALTNPEGEQQASICEALKGVVAELVAGSKKVAEDEAEALSRAGVAVALGAAVIVVASLLTGGVAGGIVLFGTEVISATGVAAAGAATGLTSAGLGVWSQRVKDVNKAIFDDTARPPLIVCSLYQALRFDEDISFEDFSNVTPQWPDGVDTTEAEELWYVIQPLWQQEATYQAFLDSWKRSQQFNAAGVDADCDCEDLPDGNIVIVGDYGFVEYKGKVAAGDKWLLVGTSNPFAANRGVGIAHTGGLFKILEIAVTEGVWYRADATSDEGSFTYWIDNSPPDTIDEVADDTRGIYQVSFQSPVFTSGDDFEIEIVVVQKE